MSNFLKMDLVNAIQALKSKGWSKRRIAGELQIDRQTVRKHIRAASNSPPVPLPATAQVDSGQNHPLSTPGSERPSDQNHPLSTLGNSEVTAAIERVFAEPSGRPSKCQTYAELIETKVHRGLSAQRIYQDLVIEVGFKGSYQAVKRFVRRLKESSPKPICRVEVQPAEEAQVDFGSGALVNEPSGRRRKPWIFRIVLSFSRKAYSEAVWYQTTETFIRCLENAFRYFGGVTKTLNLDNLRAAVSRADWYDPDLNPKLECFCRHYGIALMPCRPRHPEHKGKCERNIGYLKSNALKGRSFASLAEQNQFLAHWEQTVADVRIHGTTRKQVAALFAEEQPALLPLPTSLFPCFQEAERTVHRDAHVEIDKAYYHVPPEYIGRTVWARWDGRCVRLFNQRWDQIAMHAKLEAGQFTNVRGVGGGQGTLERQQDYWLRRASEMGQPCADWARGLIGQRGPTAIRSLIGLVNLSRKHSFKAINEACAAALSRGLWRLREVRALLDQPNVQTHFQFAQHHPLIRNLAEYGLFIKAQY